MCVVNATKAFYCGSLLQRVLEPSDKKKRRLLTGALFIKVEVEFTAKVKTSFALNFSSMRSP